MEQTDKLVTNLDGFDYFTIIFDFLISIAGGLAVNHLIPILKDKFIRAQLWGYDLNNPSTVYGLTLAGYGVIFFFIGKIVAWFQKN